jgi:translation initiation factor 5B
MGVKISAPNLDGCVAGSPLLVCGPRDDLEELKDEVQEEIQSVLARIDRSGKGVWVQASTLGSLEALLTFLGESKIPVMNMAIGPLQKKHLMASAVMLEHKPEFAVILAFDVKVSPEIRKMGEDMGVKIFAADIIYHLFDQMTAHMKKIKDERRAAAADTIVFPCVLELLEDHIYNKKDPIVVGVRVKEGVVKLGTPLCCPSAKVCDAMITRSCSPSRFIRVMHHCNYIDTCIALIYVST